MICMHNAGAPWRGQPRSVDVFVSGCPGANGTWIFDGSNRRDRVVIVFVDFESALMPSNGTLNCRINGVKCSGGSVQMRYISPSQ
jgi:hypothetical protein